MCCLIMQIERYICQRLIIGVQFNMKHEDINDIFRGSQGSMNVD